jgi:hypothetical protein
MRDAGWAKLVQVSAFVRLRRGKEWGNLTAKYTKYAKGQPIIGTGR